MLCANSKDFDQPVHVQRPVLAIANMRSASFLLVAVSVLYCHKPW